ncbi:MULTISPECIES: hypothetical protein [unclassified Nostoc]|uniref:hypothetical protein n=1 Tax=unclassified Nostoc TaxID=2593658 RepID=UPI002610A0F9|nr:hypothetical protein [Nostoc sp. S13]MDF5740169.1 hypothetical protein [Nostoc sp. S13]
MLHPTKKQATHSIDYRRKLELNFWKILKTRSDASVIRHYVDSTLLGNAFSVTEQPVVAIALYPVRKFLHKH